MLRKIAIIFIHLKNNNKKQEDHRNRTTKVLQPMFMNNTKWSRDSLQVTDGKHNLASYNFNSAMTISKRQSFLLCAMFMNNAKWSRESLQVRDGKM